MNDNFTTEDYSLANWLVFNNVVFLGAVAYPNNPKKEFVFIDEPAINELVKEWENGSSIEAELCKNFFRAHVQIKKALKRSLDV